MKIILSLTGGGGGGESNNHSPYQALKFLYNSEIKIYSYKETLFLFY
jgi:hypothetical protein